ncbi:MAG: hypothetical protein V7L29_29315 [Nostoc sp.]|uniref:hypothetical protein n=1 Tax=Nostoc sp. TaxID=1180 RepID=UPI002FFCF76B
MIQLYSPLRNISRRTSDRTRNRNELLNVGFLVVRGDTNLNNERRTNNDSQI